MVKASKRQPVKTVKKAAPKHVGYEEALVGRPVPTSGKAIRATPVKPMKQTMHSYKQLKPTETKPPPGWESEPLVAAPAMGIAPPTPMTVAPPTVDIRDEQIATLSEDNNKLGAEINKLKAENAALNRLRDALGDIETCHRDVGDQITALVQKHTAE